MRSCTAPKEGHQPGSIESKKCPVCGTQDRPGAPSVAHAMPSLSSSRLSAAGERAASAEMSMFTVALAERFGQSTTENAESFLSSLYESATGRIPGSSQDADRWDDAGQEAHVRAADALGGERSSQIKRLAHECLEGLVVRTPKRSVGPISFGGKPIEGAEAKALVTQVVEDSLLAAEAKASGANISDADYDRLSFAWRSSFGRLMRSDGDVSEIDPSNW